MQAGVRVCFATDSDHIGGQLIVDSAADIAYVVDIVAAGVVHSCPVDAEGRFGIDGIADAGRQPADVEVWLPQFGLIWLAELYVDSDAVLAGAAPVAHPALVCYGSSITQCRGATSPTATWPARVARELSLDLRCLGFGGQCHLDPLIAHTIGDMAADIIVLCVGINIYAAGSFSARSLGPALMGFVSTIRERHPEAPIALMTPIIYPQGEKTPNQVGMTLEDVRDVITEAAHTMLEFGDSRLSLIAGPSIFRPADEYLLADGLHPSGAGYDLMAARLSPVLKDLLQ
ncbi:hypothetical protein GCM10011575_30830 [Microlunatus endophyticus]|uniref:SGNH hydrolase-type esterase domain-containing protein n=2 Tax=Microlunatus endophyticus TaxID=1716077 RepID=A0A917W6V1_9ACTN|nr:SGNH/GDSL hydrolase family protein [Microlunatus endophyticus]GGL70127.1 hypothetical protein GCM10011575_30830 [Microlunatus endophyticus]